MKRYPVFKALYRPLLTAGVPLPLLSMEIAFVALFLSIGLFLAVIPVLLVHIASMVAMKADPYILSIILDLSSLKGGRR